MDFRKFILVLVILVVAFCLLPAIFFLTGKYNAKSFFSKPPSAVLENFRCDHNVLDENGVNTMQLTAVINTHNIVDSTIILSMEFYYSDGSPMLSNLDRKPVAFQKQLEVHCSDTSITDVTYMDYNVFPNESLGQEVECRTVLTYSDWTGERERHEQDKTLVLYPDFTESNVLSTQNNNPKTEKQKSGTQNKQSKETPISLGKSENTDGRTALVKDITIRHNTRNGGQDGITLTVNFVCNNLKNANLYRMVSFYNEDKSEIQQKIYNEKYRSQAGTVIVGDFVVPPSSPYTTKIDLFIPYNQLSASGQGNSKLLLSASILNFRTNTDVEVLDISNFYPFYVEKL